MQLTIKPMHIVIPLSVVYVLTVVAQQEEKQYIGRLFLKYLEYFGNEDHFHESEPYSFMRFYSDICKQCHLSTALLSADINRVLLVFLIQMNDW